MAACSRLRSTAIITGFGGDILIVDDPHDISDVRNPELLDQTVEIFDAEVRSRLNNRKRPRILVIAHRIHDRDLSAHLLGQGDWAHVILPLVATRDQTYDTDYGRWHRRKGELLQPEAEDEDDIARRKRLLVNPDFDMLYQQDCDGQARPINAGDFPTFVPGDHADLHCVISIDAGNTKGDDASFSVVQAWAFDDKNLYLMNQFREQCDFNELKRMTKRFIKDHQPYVVLIENTANGPALISELRRKEKTRHLVLPITPRGSKAARLNRHIDEEIRDGRVQLPEGAVFNAKFVAEFESISSSRACRPGRRIHANGGLVRAMPRARQGAAAWSSLLCPWSLAATVSFMVLTHGNRLPLSQRSGECAHGAGTATFLRTERAIHQSEKWIIERVLDLKRAASLVLVAWEAALLMHALVNNRHY